MSVLMNNGVFSCLLLVVFILLPACNYSVKNPDLLLAENYQNEIQKEQIKNFLARGNSGTIKGDVVALRKKVRMLRIY